VFLKVFNRQKWEKKKTYKSPDPYI
jgi:hypothetical protein